MSGAPGTHVARQFHVSGLQGISDATLDVHMTLYAGYVTALNEVEERLAEIAASGTTGTPQHRELLRRREFEHGGLALHELYFDNLERHGGQPIAGGPFDRLVAETFGDEAAWRRDLLEITKTRGVGWVVTACDLPSGRLVNRWLPVHELAGLKGAVPLLVMDLWEHAWLLDYKPAERPHHVEAFLQNVSWRMVERRASELDLPMLPETSR